MSPDELNCWQCGANLKDIVLPIGRRDECPACRSELHVCRMCRHYAPGKAKQCMEPMAEDVREKTRANFCDWFQPAPSANGPSARAQDRAALASLFGDSAPEPERPAGPRHALDDLFGD